MVLLFWNYSIYDCTTNYARTNFRDHVFVKSEVIFILNWIRYLDKHDSFTLLDSSKKKMSLRLTNAYRLRPIAHMWFVMPPDTHADGIDVASSSLATAFYDHTLNTKVAISSTWSYHGCYSNIWWMTRFHLFRFLFCSSFLISFSKSTHALSIS